MEVRSSIVESHTIMPFAWINVRVRMLQEHACRYVTYKKSVSHFDIYKISFSSIL